VLTTAKKRPHPAEFFATSYQAHADAAACTSCATCGSRCQIEAIVHDDGPAFVKV